MNIPDREYIGLALGSILKVARRYYSTEDLAREFVDVLGIFDASDIAYHINELEKTIPTNETENHEVIQ